MNRSFRPAGNLRGELIPPAGRTTPFPIGNSSHFCPPPGQKTASASPSRDQSAAIIFRPISKGAPPFIGTRESAPPVMFIVPPEVSSASSPREDTEARLTPTTPRLRDSGLAGRVQNSARAPPPNPAENR